MLHGPMTGLARAGQLEAPLCSFLVKEEYWSHNPQLSHILVSIRLSSSSTHVPTTVLNSFLRLHYTCCSQHLFQYLSFCLSAVSSPIWCFPSNIAIVLHGPMAQPSHLRAGQWQFHFLTCFASSDHCSGLVKKNINLTLIWTLSLNQVYLPMFVLLSSMLWILHATMKLDSRQQLQRPFGCLQ